MPVLNKLTHKKAKLPENLSPDERVFFIPSTKEVFRDYRTFFDRAMLYNTAAWSCAVSGKNGFTFKEALDYENHARQDVESFPQSLKVPVLYLVTLIKRRSCSDLVDDLVAFIKDRFFVNEDVVYTGDNGEKLSAVIKKVHCEQEPKPPSKPKIGSDDDDDDDDECLATIAAQNKNPPPSAYKYDITLTNGSGNVWDMDAVSASQLGRKKNAVSKDKLKMFLKAQCRVGSEGFWKVKTHLMALGLEDPDAITSFFTLPIPKFRLPVDSRRKSSSKPTTSPSLKKKSKSKSSSISKSKNDDDKKKKKLTTPVKREEFRPIVPVILPVPLSKEELAAQRRFELEHRKQMKEQEHLRLIEEKKVERERQKEERIREKQRQIEERKRQLEYLREYNKPRDDMQCDDLCPLPRAVSIQLQHIDTKLFPEIVYVIEFCHIFREFLELDLSQLNIKNIELAVQPYNSSQQLDGLFFDLLTTLLRAIFDLRKAENEEDNEHDTSLTDTTDQAVDPDNLTADYDFSIKNVQKSSKFCTQQLQSRYGMEVEALPITTATLSEILRIHIWSSAALRHYNSSDEPAIDFCHLNPQIVRELASLPVFDLDPSAKLKILRLLMDQLLVFADFRDYVEESLEKVKESKIHLAEVQAEHAKWVKARDFNAVREKSKLKPSEPTTNTNPTEGDAQKPAETDEEKKQKREVKTAAQKIQKCIVAFQQQEVEPFVEQTRRSSRRGQGAGSGKSSSEQLLEDSENYILDCNTAVLAQLSEDECVAFDRWRQQVVSKRITVIEQELQEISNLILLHQRIYNLRPLGQDRCYRHYWSFSMVPGLFVEEAGEDIPPELMIPVPQLPPKKNQPPGDIVPQPLLSTWGFYSVQQDIEQLVECLNTRGFRESELKQNLSRQLGNLFSNLDKCPVDMLVTPPKSDVEPMETSQPPAPVETVNMEFELQLRDQLLELEEKIFLGLLGSLQGPDRQVWRNALINGVFQAGVPEVKFGLNGVEQIVESPSTENPPSTETVVQEKLISVHKLAIALLQIEQGVDRKFVKAPLWPNVNEQVGKGKAKSRKAAIQSEEQDDDNSKQSDHTPQKPTIATWEESLMRCTSFSQVFLHLATLDSSVLWSRSILKAHCRICRRRGDPASMLLCDGCNLGFHCYCLRPPLKKIPEGDWYCLECRPVTKPTSARRQGRPRKQPRVEDEPEDSTPPPRLGMRTTRRTRVAEVEPEPEEEPEEPEEEEESENEEESGENESESEEVSAEDQSGEEEEGQESDSDAGSGSGESGSEEGDQDGEESAATISRTGSSRTNVDSDEDSEEESGGSGRSESGGSQSRSGEFNEDGSEDGESESGQSGSGEDRDEEQEEDASDTSEKKRSGKASRPAKKRINRDLDYSDSNASVRSLTPVCALCSANAADDMAYVRCDTCQTVYHLDCVVPNPLTRKPRGGWSCFSCTTKPTKRQSAPVSHPQPTSKRDQFEYASSASSSNSNQAWSTSRADQSTKKAEQLVGELIKNQDAWPFLKPVNKKQVPDYFDIIKHPMDFGTIKVKINDSPYKDAGTLLDDCLLVFDNCFVYNQQGDAVFTSGLSLFKVFMQRVRELQLDSMWTSFKSAQSKLSKYSDGKRGASNNGNDAVPAKQSRRG